jgi:hypothetical protein
VTFLQPTSSPVIYRGPFTCSRSLARLSHERCCSVLTNVKNAILQIVSDFSWPEEILSHLFIYMQDAPRFAYYANDSEIIFKTILSQAKYARIIINNTDI